MKTRMRFTKTGSMKFIGHLDCMRFFQKAIRRASLDVAYSKGYSPHQLMSFASPLGVGITSDGEYMDVEFNSLPDMPMDDLVNYLNRYMTDEIYVTDISIMPDSFKNSMSLLEAADYMIAEKEEYVFPKDWKIRWNEYIHQPSIMVTKKTKRSEKEIDIKPYIYKYAFSLPEFSQKTKEKYLTPSCPYDHEALYIQLASGSEHNIKPTLLLEAFYTYCGVIYPKYSCHIHRLQMYFRDTEGKGGAL